jgi:hypothetical protein
VTGHDVGQELTSLGAFPLALSSLRAAWDIYAELSAGDPSNVMHQHDRVVMCNDIGNAEAKSGDMTTAIADYTRGAAIMRALVAKSPEDASFQQELVEIETALAKALIEKQQNQTAAPTPPTPWKRRRR